jgi:hypothetical protein
MASKKSVFGRLAMVLTFGLLLTGGILMGCASSGIINTYMNQSISVREHAVLLVDENVLVTSVDGDYITLGIYSGNKTSSILLPFGKHVFQVSFLRSSAGVRETTTETSDPVILYGDFLAGHIYRLRANVNSGTVSFQIVEENDPSIWDSKDLASVKYPKKMHMAVTIQNAANASPTALEGAWLLNNPASQGEEVIEVLYTFTGHSYSVFTTKHLNAEQFAQMNQQRRILGVLPLSSPELHTGVRGTFETIGNTIKCAYLQVSEDQQLWLSLEAGRLTYSNYEYSISREGNLLLTNKDGAMPVLGSGSLVLVKRE